ncbi:HD domain-containing protein [Mycoplasmoides pneumoniae]|uniref:Uncharacterized protein MG461 homolog n=1 Tax=Mycoplasma pneumoniae (strain ATCC 29342 / M129 / Subtype 1) TaxID=272634 RepID=Y677_MYCPN|nr:HD domain-containing protein [Mycoplasmoides pneumoniae]P75115.1 RecName: Full=Uncharacterized protein MG461 homolog [Mycoplasmoides pneumoniae M129]AAB95813.1 puative ATPase [Mycoplasmoides pneumoniae M129]AGC04546.1 hypothetical protein C985_0682 [Mycoplasmoides pneumoniae M129-B7]ALA30540.1 hypothetical protein C897_03810 [Mycoplasmoides pneumoniae PI 1428]ALA32647.1 hypothetical protein F533_03810 [Mycoplasmoides pneumoniae 51494]ALA33348.1 hypothetical protein F530_03820 [Mycoplasmoid
MQQIFFKDPILGEVLFDQQTKWMYELVETEAFRRLRNIKQLGINFHFYPGGVHTRYSHSLGVYELLRRILNTPAFAPIDENKKQTVLVAGLLHDIGHAPHSHAFEIYFAKAPNFKKELFIHEEVTTLFVNSEPIKSILKANQIDPKLVAALIDENKELKPSNYWMRQLISSDLDADRMDYLLRDSYFTGTSHSLIDYQTIIKEMDCVKVKGIYEIFFKDKCLPLIENFLITRHHMYQSIYSDGRSISTELNLWFVFQRIKDLVDKNQFDFNGYKTLEQVCLPLLKNEHFDKKMLPAFVKLDDYVFQSFFVNLYQTTKDKILKKLLDSYLNSLKFEIKFYETKEQRDLDFEKQASKYKDAKYFITKFNNQFKGFYEGWSSHKNELKIKTMQNKHTNLSEISMLVKRSNELFFENALYKWANVFYRL